MGYMPVPGLPWHFSPPLAFPLDETGFLACFRAEDNGKNDKTERGTKVKHRLSCLRNRVTGYRQKDKVREKSGTHKGLTALSPERM